MKFPGRILLILAFVAATSIMVAGCGKSEKEGTAESTGAMKSLEETPESTSQTVEKAAEAAEKSVEEARKAAEAAGEAAEKAAEKVETETTE